MGVIRDSILKHHFRCRPRRVPSQPKSCPRLSFNVIQNPPYPVRQHRHINPPSNRNHLVCIPQHSNKLSRRHPPGNRSHSPAAAPLPSSPVARTPAQFRPRWELSPRPERNTPDGRLNYAQPLHMAHLPNSRFPLERHLQPVLRSRLRSQRHHRHRHPSLHRACRFRRGGLKGA